MVIPKKKARVKTTLADLEASSKLEVNQVDGKRQDIQKAIEKKYLSAQFFFSVVFPSEDDMRAYCANKGIKLRDGEYIFAKDLDKTMQRREK